MYDTMRQEELRALFDQTTREVTEQATGIRLQEGGEEPAGEIYTVHAEFERGFYTSVSLCAEETLFIRVARRMMRREAVTPEDVEDFSKEYFNVLCGHIAAKMYQATKVASRFGIPSFYRGRYKPGGTQPHFVISYTGDGNERAQLIHHTPFGLDMV